MSSIQETYDGNVNSWIMHKIIDYPKNNIKILDVGCWKGQLGKEVLSNRNDCIFFGIERFASPDFAEAAGYRQVFDIDLHKPDLMQGIEKGFDIIVCGDVLEHTLEPEKVLEELKQLLNEDGIILVSLPNICFIQNRITHLLGFWNYAPSGSGGIMDNTHYRFFSLSSMKQLFVRTGLKTIEYRGLGFIRSFLKILNPLVWLFPATWAMQIVFLLKK